MKKGFIWSAIMVLLLSSFLVQPMNTVFAEKNYSIEKKQKQMKIIDQFERLSERNQMNISWDQKRGIPDFISGILSEKKITSTSELLAYLNRNKSLFDLDAGEFRILEITTDQLGMSHYKTQLVVDNIPVYGAELLIHTDKNGIVVAINGQVEPQLANVKWTQMVKVTQEKAVDEAKKSLSFQTTAESFSTEPKGKLFLFEHQQQWQPVYLVDLQYIQPEAGRTFVFVNAINGRVIYKYDAITDAATTGTGIGVNGVTKTLNTYSSNNTYYLYDTTKAMNGIIKTYTANNGTTLPGSYATDTDNNFNLSSQAAAVDAHYYAGVTYDYYYNKFNRNSYDNNGSDIISTVNYSTNYNNAFWNGSQMVYGDGDGTTFIPLSGALDVVAHELTHAVTEKTANLIYQDQSGALNESFSDVFGFLVEAYHGDTDWLMGEDVYTPRTAGDALRSLSNPTLYDQPDHMDNYLNTTSDNGGVHTNSGIPNKAFYNIATTISLDKAGAIYYRALTTYLTSQSDFNDARNALLQSATDLYSSTSVEYQAVSNGYAAVGIGETTSTSDTYEPNGTLSSAYGPLTSGTTYNSYIWSSSDVDYFKFSTTSTGTISVSLSNLAGDYDVYLYNTSGTQLSKSENGGTTNESISYSTTTTGTFYVKVVGYNGASSTTKAYALNVTYPTSSQTTAQWYYETMSADTPHPYTNNYNSGHTYTKTGAQKVAIHFSQFETEAGYDFVYIKDKNGNIIAQYDGTKAAFWAIVDGDSITSNLVSDYSVTAYGYHIDQVAYYSTQQLITNDNLETSSVTPIE